MTEQETEAQRGQVICPKSHSQSAVIDNLKPGLSDSHDFHPQGLNRAPEPALELRAAHAVNNLLSLEDWTTGLKYLLPLPQQCCLVCPCD